MNIWKISALCFIAGTVFVVGYRAASADASCNNQPNMAAALSNLRDARGWLDKAEHNKGGWRDRAIGATDNALRETNDGCNYADHH
jgi:hypothetical protein